MHRRSHALANRSLPCCPTPVLAASCQRPALQALRIALHQTVVQLRGSSTDQPLLETNQSQRQAPKVNGFELQALLRGLSGSHG